MEDFFKVQSVKQVQGYAGRLDPLPPETVGLDQAADRTLAHDLRAPDDLPGFTRSCMDGFAVRSRDTFGAGEGSPAYLTVVGRVEMGTAPDFAIAPGQCARISTGGMLPQGADAVVMLEHSRMLDDTTVEMVKTSPPGGNLMGPTDDAAKGQVLLKAGQRLRPQDVGLLAALGFEQIQAVQKPRVGIISTGDEVVPVSAAPLPGQVRDVNTYTLAALVRSLGGEPVPLGLVRDDQAGLKKAVERSLGECDLTLLSGGSSVGTRDFTAETFLSFPGSELWVHGVAVSPGKPFIWVNADGRQLMGLPGQVASCMVAFHIFVEPVLERLLGREPRSFTRFPRGKAVLSRPAPSAPGREEYVRVRLSNENGSMLAEPVFGKSGLLTTLIQGQGLIRIPQHSEGLYQGDPVNVYLFP